MAEETKEKKPRAKRVGSKMSKKAQEAASAASPENYGVILSPVITEKSSVVGGAGNRVVFRVDRRASKTDIKTAVERAFKVTVREVNTINYLGKPKRTSRSMGRRAAFKKAYVTLAEGQTINVIEGL